jgi:hypothetical protein
MTTDWWWGNRAALMPGGGGSTTTWNPADSGTKVALSGGNLTAAHTSTTGVAIVRSVASHSTGQFYWEITVNTTGAATLGIGIANATKNLNTTFLGGTTDGVGYYSNGGVSYNSATAQTIQTFTSGDVVGVAIDIANKGLWIRKNGGNWNNSGTANPVTNTGSITNSNTFLVWNAAVFAAVDVEGTTDSVTANFGATAYGTAAPAGFGNL